MMLAKQMKHSKSSIIPEERNTLNHNKTKYISRVKKGVIENRNAQIEERSTQTVLKSLDCKVSCPILKEVGVKTDCYRVSFSEQESTSTSRSSESVVRKCDEIVKRMYDKSDTEDEIFDSNRTVSSTSRTPKGDNNVKKRETIKNVVHIEGPDIECNISQYKINISHSKK